MPYRNLILILFLSTFLSCTTKKQQPNFVFILVDDLGWADVKCNYPESFYEWNKTNVALGRMGQTNSILLDSRWAVSISDLLTGQNISTIEGVLRYLIPLMTAGSYTGEDIQMGYDILTNGGAFSMQESRLRALVGYLANQPEFHLQ